MPPRSAEPEMASRWKARSRADWKRASGDFSRQRTTTRSSAGGMVGLPWESQGGSSRRMACSVSTALSRRKGAAPVIIS